jgi:hypothetical protein
LRHSRNAAVAAAATGITRDALVKDAAPRPVRRRFERSNGSSHSRGISRRGLRIDIDIST